MRRQTFERLLENQKALYVARRLADVIENLDARLSVCLTTEAEIMGALTEKGREGREVLILTPAERSALIAAAGLEGDAHISCDPLDDDAAARLATGNTCGVPIRVVAEALARVRASAKKTQKRKAFLVAGLRAYLLAHPSGRPKARPADLLARLEAEVKQGTRRFAAEMGRSPVTAHIGDLLREIGDSRRASRALERRHAGRAKGEAREGLEGLTVLGGFEPPNDLDNSIAPRRIVVRKGPKRCHDRETRTDPAEPDSRSTSRRSSPDRTTSPDSPASPKGTPVNSRRAGSPRGPSGSKDRGSSSEMLPSGSTSSSAAPPRRRRRSSSD